MIFYTELSWKGVNIFYGNEINFKIHLIIILKSFIIFYYTIEINSYRTATC